MATTDFTVTRNQIIRRALRVATVVAEGEEPTGDQNVAGAEALNALMKSLQNEGILDWTLESATITMVIGQVKYALATDTFKILNASISVSGVSYPVDIVSAATFDSQPTAANAQPTMAYFNPKVETITTTGPTLSFYPAPSATSVVTYRKIRKLSDFDTALDTPDTPQSWFDALTYLLAANLIDEYGIPNKHDQVMQKAMMYKQNAMGAFDTGWKMGRNVGSSGGQKQ